MEHRFEWQSEERYGEAEIETNFFAAQIINAGSNYQGIRESRGNYGYAEYNEYICVSKEAANRKTRYIERRYHYNWRSSAARAG